VFGDKGEMEERDPSLDRRLESTLPFSPDSVLYFTAGLFAVTGVVAMSNETYATTSDFLFQGFMNVGMAAFVVAATWLSLRRSDLPRTTWWNVVTGYIAGIGFIGSLLLWAYVPELRAGLSLLALREEFVFYGNLGGLFGFFVGVSRARSEYNRRLRRKLEARQRELEHQIERLDEFAGIVSHDLRNPLSVAKGHLELLAEDRELTEHPDVRKVERALDRMSRLIDDLLELARAGQQVDELRPVSLRRVVRSAWSSVETNGAELRADVDGRVLADESRLTQLLENLFRNAVEHGGRDVTVTVGALPDGFFVADDGPGVPEADREEIVDAGYSTNDAGTGFGLSIAQEIVDAHGWRVDVTESESGGARFEFRGVEADE
jgi:signal transduction histidine kinase